MTLFQISEPGESPAPHEHKLAIGIDLGTTNSLVATVRNSHPEVLPDALGRRLLPSVVHYGVNGIEVGDAAMAQAGADPKNTIASVKRLMGKALADVPDSVRARYNFAASDGKSVMLSTRSGERTPLEVSADILRSLKARAEESLGVNEHRLLHGAVITVPAYFDDAQRQATKDAAKLAGLNVLRLINEPTAAAVAYGLDQRAEGTFLVYDLGGGTFDVSILRLTKGLFEVLATAGDSQLGGDDFDEALADWARAQCGGREQSAAQERMLLAAARVAKERLSLAQSATITVHQPGGAQVAVNVTREQFDALALPLVQKTMLPVKRALRDAKMKPHDVNGVVLVGGATRTPLVRATVEQFFCKAPLANINPDEVVAIGAAIQANVLAGNKAASSDDDFLLLDVTPLSLGLEMMGGLVEKVIPRNSTLPISRAQEFTTYKDGQSAMALHVVQGERELVADCRSLARFELRGIPPMVAGAARILVTFQVDADGLLSVSAQEASTGVRTEVSVKPSYGLADDEVARMLQDSYTQAAHDKEARALAEARVDAAQLIDAVEAALSQDAALLQADEMSSLNLSVKSVQDALLENNRATIESATKALAAASDEFASRRMDASIAKALRDKRIEDL